jgi:alpha-N-arabinofuranosidase
MKKTLTILFFTAVLAAGRAEQATLTVEGGQPVGTVSPTFYGLMTEEINYSYDGGLYAELVRNRAFLDNPDKPSHWSVVQPAGAAAAMALDRTQPLNRAIPVSLRFEVATASPAAPAGIANDGYWGIPVQPATRYHASFHAKAAPGFAGPVTVAMVSDDGQTVFAKAQVKHLTADWQRYEVTLKTDRKAAPTAKARLVLSVEHPGTVWFGFVSLFPPTWQDQPNGFRRDLMQMLVDLRPKFLRFPGGNYVEGDTVAERFDWKQTIGPVELRPGHRSPWGYRSTDGMGLLEFLRWCEDMGAEPVLAVYAGYSLKGDYVKPGPDLKPFVQDALDEIEYVTGDKSTHWGAERAKDGHPKPFKLRYVEIGNEDFFDKSGSYDGRFAQFFDAIRLKYPGLKCIATVGNEQPAEKRVHSRPADALDEHYYLPASEFIQDSPGHFENYNRRGPEIFVGEWAAYETSFPPWNPKSSHEPPTPNMLAALGDAAWMAAMERNADVVRMNCYAPLFVNINGRQWRPDMIGYDALRAFGSPSYYAFRLFSRNVGDQLLKVSLGGGAKLDCSATRDSRSGAIYLKIVNPAPAAQSLEIHLDGVSSVASEAAVETLSADPAATNSMADPAKVAPVVTRMQNARLAFIYQVPAESIIVLKFKPGGE